MYFLLTFVVILTTEKTPKYIFLKSFKKVYHNKIFIQKLNLLHFSLSALFRFFLKKVFSIFRFLRVLFLKNQNSFTIKKNK